MQGVEILTSAQVATEHVFNWTAFWIAFGIVAVLVLLYAMIYFYDDICAITVIVGFVTSLIAGTLLGTLVGKISETPVAYETQYKITISDEVSMTEFYEHYEVIEQDGKIFTVREKTNESN